MITLISNSRKFGPIPVGVNKPEVYPKHTEIEAAFNDKSVTRLYLLEVRTGTEIRAVPNNDVVHVYYLGNNKLYDFTVRRDYTAFELRLLSCFSKVEKPQLRLSMYEVSN